MYGRVYNAGIWATMGLMVLSAICGGFTDLSFSASGYFWQMVNSGCTAANMLYLKCVGCAFVISDQSSSFSLVYVCIRRYIRIRMCEWWWRWWFDVNWWIFVCGLVGSWWRRWRNIRAMEKDWTNIPWCFIIIFFRCEYFNGGTMFAYFVCMYTVHTHADVFTLYLSVAPSSSWWCCIKANFRLCMNRLIYTIRTSCWSPAYLVLLLSEFHFLSCGSCLPRHQRHSALWYVFLKSSWQAERVIFKHTQPVCLCVRVCEYPILKCAYFCRAPWIKFQYLSSVSFCSNLRGRLPTCWASWWDWGLE